MAVMNGWSDKRIMIAVMLLVAAVVGFLPRLG